ncbi:GTP-binding protein [Streptomyces sp. PTY087I2]|uniref:GTP-binding protein n=1 Tax=Streptomyces sp. PTY087I2 TaxID=1819298 RepID=UPI00210057D4|nr:GTP-binding protein [Streptomyces sp. PTY087I2]
MVIGNTPQSRGDLIARLPCPQADLVVLSVSVTKAHSGRYPVVQRLVNAGDARKPVPASAGAVGDPAIILRQDLISLRRANEAVHVVLALPEEIDLLPFLLDLWRPRIGAASLEDHFDAAPVLMCVDPAAFTEEISCTHRQVQVWGAGSCGEPLTVAEVAARQVEAADVLVLAHVSPGGEGPDRDAALALRRLNARAGMTTLQAIGVGRKAAGHALSRSRQAARARAEWAERLDPVTAPYALSAYPHSDSGFVWRARRPFHPQRLIDALGEAMAGVVRSRGVIWLANRPDALLTWRSAGGHLEIVEAGRWLEAPASDAWVSATPQRRTMACWLWDDYYGERRNEITFTGEGMDSSRIASALDDALLRNEELALGREGWARWEDPLLGSR